MADYTIERVREILPYSDTEWFFIAHGPPHIDRYGDHFDFSNFDFWAYARDHQLWVCRRRGEICGVMMAQLYGSVFDSEVKILFQDVLYCKMSSGRAAFLLFQEFLAFGRANAKLVFTARAKYTNVKGSTLEKLGFEKVEEIYQLEV